MKPGQLILRAEPILCNAKAEAISLTVENTSDWPVQVCSHYHFFEANKRLRFDRAKAFGRRLDVPAGGGVRWEPGETHEVRLIKIAGTRESWGFNGLTEGPMTLEQLLKAMRRANERGFLSTD